MIWPILGITLAIFCYAVIAMVVINVAPEILTRKCKDQVSSQGFCLLHDTNHDADTVLIARLWIVVIPYLLAKMGAKRIAWLATDGLFEVLCWCRLATRPPDPGQGPDHVHSDFTVASVQAVSGRMWLRYRCEGCRREWEEQIDVGAPVPTFVPAEGT